MKNLVVNIGLNVGNVEPKHQLILTVDVLAHLFNFRFEDWRIHKGQWQDDEGDIIEERVYAVQINVGNLTIVAINNILEAVCEGLNQEAIAFKLNGVGHVVYNSGYKGERFEFNSGYFKEV